MEKPHGMTPENARFAPPDMQEQFKAAGGDIETKAAKAAPEPKEKTEQTKHWEAAAFGWRESSTSAVKQKFEALSDKAKDFVGGLFADKRAEIKSRIEVWNNNRLVDKVGAKSEKLKGQKNEQWQKLQGTWKEGSEFEQRLKKMEELLGVNPSVGAVAEKERRRIQKEEFETSKRHAQAERKLEATDRKKEVFENKRDSAIETFSRQIDKRIAPLDVKISTLETQREQADVKISGFKEVISENQKKLVEFEKFLGEAQFKFEKKGAKEKIKELQRVLKDAEKQLKGFEKQRDKVANGLFKVQGKKAEWQSKVDYMRGFATKKKPETAQTVVENPEPAQAAPTAAASAAPTRRARGFLGFAEEEDEENGQPLTEQGNASTVVEAESNPAAAPEVVAGPEDIEVKDTSLKGWTEAWNNNFGSQLKLGKEFEDHFKQLYGKGSTGNISYKNFEAGILKFNRISAKKNLKGGQAGVAYMRENDLKRNLRKFKTPMAAAA